MRRMLRIAGAVAAIVLASASAAAAHPLGNFTVNHLSRITSTRDAVNVRYVLDEAEIPTFALERSLDVRGTPSHDVLARWADEHAKAVASQLSVTVDGHAVHVTPRATTVRLRPGAGGLPTLYMTATYIASLGGGAHRIAFRDDTEPGRLGWKDVVTGSVTEPTRDLQAYPNAMLGSPRARTSVVASIDGNGRIHAESDDGAGAAATVASAPLSRSNALSDLLTKGASDPFVVFGAFLLAVALGALHALEPGHGKTLLAVSLVGARATPRQAVVLATALTIAHTAGVLLLGVVVLLAAQWIVPERIYPWVTLGSGIIVTILGTRALATQIRNRLPFAHAHPHPHPHAHPHVHEHVHVLGQHHHHSGGHAHDHGDLDDEAHARAHAIPGAAPLTFRSAVIAAASGNIAPCPAALVVLLAAIALHQIAYGLALIVAFSVGLASVLTVLGIAVVRSAAWLVERPRFEVVARLAPLVTAFVIATVGAVMIGQGLAAQGGPPVAAVVALILIASVGYALAWHRHGMPSEAAA